MEILYFIIGWMVGIFVASFTLIQILIILFFGTPITMKLERLGLMNKDNGIIKRYFVSFAILSLIFLGTTYVVYTFFPQLIVGFIFGGIMALFFGLGKIRLNPNNIQDYAESNSKHFKVSFEKVIGTILQR